MNELKQRLVEECERKLDYYDVVDENEETIDYGAIIDFLFKQMCKGVRAILFGGD